MAVSMFRTSSSFLGHCVRKTKTRVMYFPFNFSTDSPENQAETDESEDFFGIPTSYKLQQKRMNQGDLENAGQTRNRQSEMGSPQRAESDSSTNLFDEQYFESALGTEQQKSKSKHQAEVESTSASDSAFSVFQNTDDVNVNFIEEQYFGSHQTGSDISNLNNIYNGLSDSQEFPQDTLPHRTTLLKSSKPRSRSNKIHSTKNDNVTQMKTNYSQSNPTALKLFDVDHPDLKQNSGSQPMNQHPRNLNSLHRQQDQEPATAHDVAVKVRHALRNKKSFERNVAAAVNLNNSDNFVVDLGLTSTLEREEQEKDIGQSKKRDSKGYRILSDQLFNLDKMTTSDILLMLQKKIIFDHEDFLAIDKPYGLPSLGNNSDRLSLTNLLPRLCKILPSKYNASDLHLVQGLDRDVTGAVILAKNEESAYLLKGMFNSNEIIQRFWAITKGVPNPNHGIVDIPIGEAKVENFYKMVLRPLYSNDPNFRRRTSKSHSYEAVTDFKVLASHQEAALVECQPMKKLVRHQIRVHLSNGLNTPILGDHKYSHFSKLAPQKLNHSTLELLHIRQAKVRHLALHLHCHTLVIPHYKSKMIFIPTKLPPHFIRNMKSLRLSEKRHK